MRITETLDSFFPKEKDDVLINPLIFGNFKNALNVDSKQLYEDYESYEVVQKMFEEVILDGIALKYRSNNNIYFFFLSDLDGV